MVETVIGCATTFVIARIYLNKNEINIGINNNIVALGLSIIIVLFLSLIQLGFGAILNIFL